MKQSDYKFKHGFRKQNLHALMCYENAYTHTRYENKQFVRYTIKEINSRNGKTYLLWQKGSRYATADGTETTLKCMCWCHDRK